MFYIAKRYFKGHSGETLPLRTTESDFKAMPEDEKPKPPRLEGEAALELWRKGSDAWNSWIAQNPGIDISFVGVDFSTKRDSEGNLSFANYNFGEGNTNFSGASFGDGDVNFSRAIFGNVNFMNATFGDGNVNFFKANFKLNFFAVQVHFSFTNFGNGDVNFYRATFGDGIVNFLGTNFGNGYVDFSMTTFGNGEVTFGDATFANSKVSFNQAKLSNLIFNPTAIGSSDFDATGLSIKSGAIFKLPSSADTLKSFNLHSASFDGPLTLAGILGIVPDLRATRYSHQVDLSALNVKLPRAWQAFRWPPKLSPMAEDPHDGSRLRRLKEIAETNKDHQAALRFSADENRARRWIKTSWFGSVLDLAFSACSDYGQNILRPFLILVAIAVASIGSYKALVAATFAAWWTDPGWAQSFLLSVSNSLPFLPQSRDVRTTALKMLYGTATDPGTWVDTLMIGQGVVSFVFLFLIGLGLRNRFRL